jgi:hypothetical protein
MADDWPDERREVAFAEARAVIEAQNRTMTDIDNKAMRTVRLNTVLLGLLVTGFQFAPDTFHRTAIEAGFGALVLSTVSGVITYNESNLYVGPKGDYIEDLSTDTYSNPPWEIDVLETMAGMVAENYDDIRRNSGWLTATQALLVTGIVLSVLAAAI